VTRRAQRSEHKGAVSMHWYRPLWGPEEHLAIVAVDGSVVLGIRHRVILAKAIQSC